MVARLATRHDVVLRRGRQHALVGEARVGTELLVLAFPQTFMNLSGQSVVALMRRYGIEDDLEHLVVVHDELDLPTGRVKVKEGGGTAGHNGLESIRSHLQSGDFLRVRVGIGRPPGRQAGADYVLHRPGATERVELDVAVAEAADAVEMIRADGAAAAMNVFNANR